MLDMLNHLFPDFAHMFSNDPNAISAWFWLVMLAIFGLACVFLAIYYKRFRLRLLDLRSLLKDLNKETLALSRRETMRRAEQLKSSNIGGLWREFDESLVVSQDCKQLFNTLDAEYFFNARTLASGLTASRLLAAAPSFLVAIGVLGTFVGLTIGLGGLADTTNDIDALKGGIDTLISGASVAFMTSVWGVAFSLVLNVLEKWLERFTLEKIQDLQYQIDFLYPRIPAEQSLVHIAEYGKESKEALQELHERIGDRLQETVTGISEIMQQAIADALNSVMAPAIQTLISTTSQQSTEVLEQLVGRFMDGMTSVGREQGSLMQQAAADVHSAVGDMGERINQLAQTLDDIQGRQLAGAEQQRQLFESQLERITYSAEERQQQMEQRFTELMGGLGSQLEAQLQTAEQREQQRVTRHKEQQNMLLEQQQQLLESLGQTGREQITAITETSATQQRNFEETVGKLLIAFNEQASSHGQQAELRESERQQRLSAMLETMAGQQQELLGEIAQAVQATQQQSLLMAEQHRQLLADLKHSSDAVEQSSKHMNGTASQLGVLAVNVQSAAELLGQRLEQVTQRIDDVGGQNAMLAEQVQSQADSLQMLQQALLETAQQFEQAASEARNGFGEMKQHQQEYLSSVRSEFKTLGDELRSQVESIEKQAEQWLHAYSTEVSQQVHERMDQWNKETLGFANQMHAVVQAISNVVDELEAAN